jgi:hypothetical protein
MGNFRGSLDIKKYEVFYIKGPPEKALKAFIYDFKYPEILLILSKQKGDSWPLLGAFLIPPILRLCHN